MWMHPGSCGSARNSTKTVLSIRGRRERALHGRAHKSPSFFILPTKSGSSSDQKRQGPAPARGRFFRSLWIRATHLGRKPKFRDLDWIVFLPTANILLGIVCESFRNKSESVSQVLCRTIPFAFYYLVKVLRFMPYSSKTNVNPLTLRIHRIQNDL